MSEGFQSLYEDLLTTASKRQLRIEEVEAELKAAWTAIAPVLEWYQNEEQDRPLADILGDIVSDLTHDRKDSLALDGAKRKLLAIRQAINKIVVTEGCDAGVILLSDESPTHFDPKAECQVYDHENFSPLGDALVALAKLAHSEP